ncbi:MAG: hypothetical protein HKN37_08900 [Rhodothermales bacterium]|nr:hypothetical protein [Rhodothermales bacterium]
MNELRSQRIDVPVGSVIAVVSLAAGLAGMFVGFLSTRSRAGNARRQPLLPDTSRPEVSRPTWRRIDEFQAQLDASEEVIDSLRRDYELDTGLLKLELRRLSDLLSDTRHTSRDSAHDIEAGDSYRPVRIVEAAAEVRPPIQFSTLERLADEGEIESGSS